MCESGLKRLGAFALMLATTLAASTVAAAVAAVPAPRALTTAALQPLGAIVRSEIRARHIPGAVVLVGNPGRIVYLRAFGERAYRPAALPMTTDTIFDLASLTKVVATTTAVMQLAEQGRIDLDAPVARYWPAFGANGKRSITVRELLTHYSGLAPDLSEAKPWHGYRAAMKLIVGARPLFAPGTRYLYSDINFEALGELVRRVSGQPLDVYCERHVFAPLGMRDTGFRPPRAERWRIAPTEYIGGRLRWGKVHDPSAFRMGGVAGHAGLFSSARDLGIFARMMLGMGRGNGVRILTASSVREMTVPESPPGGARLRGFGWDIGAPLAANREKLAPVGSYGHTGYTGTLLWIDPVSDTYVIILTNRVYPYGHGDAGPVRKRILDLVSQALGPISEQRVVADCPWLRPFCEPAGLVRRVSVHEPAVATGADVLKSRGFAPLVGRRVGLITNRSGLDSQGISTIRLLQNAPGVKLAAIFTPEHGLLASADAPVASGFDSRDGLPVFSLYGTFRRPTDAMLDGLDALVFDVQDAGARFYTYTTTMAYAMEAAARKGIAFYVLDRPDPIDAAVVEGPVMERDLESFTGYFPMPTRHGMTIGEMAAMFNAENHIGADLHVIRMRGYVRRDWYDQTGLRWIGPSPNLPTLRAATLYPGVAMVEGANVSVGRGTPTPFEVVGAPWIDGPKLASYLKAEKIPGARFEAVSFTPSASRYRGLRCHGVRVIVTDRDKLDTPLLGVAVACALYRLYPKRFRLDQTLGMLGSRRVLDEIRRGEGPGAISRGWQPGLEAFEKLRAKFLLY